MKKVVIGMVAVLSVLIIGAVALSNDDPAESQIESETAEIERAMPEFDESEEETSAEDKYVTTESSAVTTETTTEKATTTTTKPTTTTTKPATTTTRPTSATTRTTTAPVRNNSGYAQSGQNLGMTVYITETGKRYHYDPNCGNGTYYPATLDEALSLGLTPCNKCVK